MFFFSAEYGNKLGINFTNKPLIVETIPQKNGCFVVITLVSEKNANRKLYKVKKNEKTYLFEFKSARELLDAIDSLYKKNTYDFKNTAVSVKEKYYLIIYEKGTVPFSLHSNLTEHGAFLGDNFVLSARVMELGKILAKDNAIKIIGKTMQS